MLSLCSLRYQYDHRLVSTCLQSYLTIHISGACLNPAIVAAEAASGHMHWVTALLFSVAQVGAAATQVHFSSSVHALRAQPALRVGKFK